MKNNNKNITNEMSLPERFAKNNYSLDNISETEIMRYLLKTCITRRNAAVDIDKICAKFDRVVKLLFAPDSELGGDNGLSPSEIRRFRVIGSMFMMTRLERIGRKIKANDEPRIAEYLSLLCLSHSVEVLYILPIVGKNIKVKDAVLLSSGTEITVGVTVEGVLSVLKRFPGCTEFIMAHSHPYNSSKPSSNDVWVTERLFGRLFSAGYTIREHYVVGCDGVRRVPYDKNPLRYLFGDKGR